MLGVRANLDFFFYAWAKFLLKYGLLLFAVTILSGCDPRASTEIKVVIDDRGSEQQLLRDIHVVLLECGFAVNQEEKSADHKYPLLASYRKTESSASGQALQALVRIYKIPNGVSINVIQWFTHSFTPTQRKCINDLIFRLNERADFSIIVDGKSLGR
jgi:hypothetical protein